MDWPTVITASYLAAVGQPLCDPADLDDLPAVVLCHDTADDPVFVFANRAARDLWETPLVGMPSRLTAPVDQRAERAAALSSSGVVRGYSGVRVSATGRLFRIEDATVWPVVDAGGFLVGQAATFDRVVPVEVAGHP
ncbi:MAG: MEKHLA domain-containing protein [Actinobacteria bacterium]|nr:MEKHLA domain-containing protein [Actinomycetota bacterium]MCB8997819.1 MEKHLA domain-containing protein [Actinomycetota bacterium]MCB9414287.1 MEKHLA domain-containing protein [Actinomycetota bacterium]MCB9424032.1 MEKHLA domain-containing protein [Actinomycetota bacterium]HRY09237.1 MEKHLA domain-containing protein [Candidatus Nanopelagicales bacterium]